MKLSLGVSGTKRVYHLGSCEETARRDHTICTTEGFILYDDTMQYDSISTPQDTGTMVVQVNLPAHLSTLEVQSSTGQRSGTIEA